ncbi:hypothetical protein V2S04_11200 [Microbacterium sp. OR21]|uniref:hypothetical protein n=1 Tax=Microbacterium sp. OR21 TaxID=3095346 RepID=UPI0039B4D4DE
MSGHGVNWHPNGSDELPLLLTGGAEAGTFNLRFPPEYASEIKQLLDEAGLEHSTAMEFSDGWNLAIEAVRVLGLPGGFLALASVYKTFIKRHDGKKVVIKDGTSVSGISEKAILKIIEEQAERQRAYDAAVRAISSPPPLNKEE